MHRILIVPDDLLGEGVGSSFLDRSIFRVRSASSAGEALEICAAWRPAVVLFGDWLPDIAPAEFARRVRALEGETKLFLVRRSLDAVRDLIDSDGQLVEPVEPAQLLLTVAGLLEVRVRTGLTDGNATEITGELAEGAEVIVGTTALSAAPRPSGGAPRLPF